MPEPLTLTAVVGAALNIVAGTLYYITSILRQFGFLPLMIFLTGVLMWDMTNPVANGGYIGQIITLGSNYFFGIQISSFVLFMFTIASILVWFWAKAHEILK